MKATADDLPETLPPLRWRLTQEQIWRYAAVSGANDPMHVDPAFAAQTPFGGTIGQGLLVFGCLSELFMQGLPDPMRWIRGGRLEVRFRAPARPGDDLTARAVRVGECGVDGVPHVEYEVWCENQSQVRVVAGRAYVPAVALDGGGSSLSV